MLKVNSINTSQADVSRLYEICFLRECGGGEELREEKKKGLSRKAKGVFLEGEECALMELETRGGFKCHF